VLGVVVAVVVVDCDVAAPAIAAVWERARNTLRIRRESIARAGSPCVFC